MNATKANVHMSTRLTVLGKIHKTFYINCRGTHQVFEQLLSQRVDQLKVQSGLLMYSR